MFWFWYDNFCRRLYDQLTTEDEVEMPLKAQKSVEGQITELRKVAAKRLVLVVLDGVVEFPVVYVVGVESIGRATQASPFSFFLCVSFTICSLF